MVPMLPVENTKQETCSMHKACDTLISDIKKIKPVELLLFYSIFNGYLFGLFWWDSGAPLLGIVGCY